MLSKYCLGLSVGRADLWAVKTAKRDRRLTLIDTQHCTLDAPADTPHAKQLLAGIQALRLEPRPGLCLQVALPDPATTIGIFDFKRLPSSRSARVDLLRLRFEDEHGIPAADISVAYQPMKSETGVTRFFAVAARRAWLEPLQQALQEAGHVARVIDAASCFRFNLLRSVVNPIGNGALLTVEEDHWSLMIWRRGPCLSAVHSKWRIRTGENDLPSIAIEALRWLRSVLSEHTDESFGCLYLAAATEELASLQAACESRLSVTVSPFPVLWSAGALPRQDYPFAAVAVALSR
jgi:hypothetical protein